MATSTSGTSPQFADVLDDLESGGQFEPGEPQRGSALKWLGVLIAIVALVAGGGYAFYVVAGSVETKLPSDLLLHTVDRDDLLVTVTEDGNLESAENLDIKCEVAGGSLILWIVEDGKEVQEGEELVRLDSAALEDQINQQKIVYEKARATQIQSDKDYEVAKISVQEYLEGTYRQELQNLQAQVTIAMENLRSAENTLQHTERMFRKGYVTPLQLETQQFAVERAKLDLGAAKTAQDVLERFTKAKTLQGLESALATAEAKKNSDKAAFDLEEARLKRLEVQLKKCVIVAPRSGMVVYANEQSRSRMGGQQGAEIKEGATVREQQNILRLPDLSQMQVRVAVHESKVDQLRRGMRARVRIQDRESYGTVYSVANQPEPTSFFSAAVKEYATIVKIEGGSKDLRPGMTAEVEILVAHLQDVVTVPVAAVFGQAGQTFVGVLAGNQVEKRAVELGHTNDKSVEVKQGLQADDQIVLNPRSVFADIGETAKQPEAVDVAKRFGDGKADAKSGSMPGGPMKAEREPAGPMPGGPMKAEREPAGPGPAGEGKAGQKGGDRPRLDPMTLDKNGDKKISREEASEPPLSMFFDRVDTNGDGVLDQAELAAMRSRMRSGGGGPGGPGGPMGSGGPPPGP